MSVVIVRDLVRRYGDLVAVDGVCFDVAAGEILGLLGPNGAGKTTTLECLLGLRRPDAGSIRIEGLDALRETARVRARVGAVLQSTALPERMTPREAVRHFAALHGQPRARVGEVLEAFALGDRAGAAFATLSGGERQRLALALAFVHEPGVLVLDEPTAGLDPAARRDLHERIAACRAAGRAVLLCTHDMAEAQRLCDRVAIIDRGRIVATGTPEALIARSGATARIVVRASPAPGDLAGLAGVTSCVVEDDAVIVFASDAVQALVAVAQRLEREGCAVRELQLQPAGLEEAFLRLTGRPLSEETTA